jgi:hypothetical protein
LERKLAIDSVREAELQRWFEDAVKHQRLAGAIHNIAQMEAQLEQLRDAGLVTDQTARDGLDNGLYVKWPNNYCTRLLLCATVAVLCSN